MDDKTLYEFFRTVFGVCRQWRGSCGYLCANHAAEISKAGIHETPIECRFASLNSQLTKEPV